MEPTVAITFDAMHVTVSNGIVQNETGWLMSAFKEHRITWKMVLDFYTRVDWRFCRALGSRSKLIACFATARHDAWKSSGVFKAGASEMLMVYPVLLHFCCSVVRPLGILHEQLSSFEKLGAVLHLIRRGKAGEAVHDQLTDAIKVHLFRCKTAYPDERQKPKNHYLHHIPRHLKRDGFIMDAFVGERKNGVVKRLVSEILNTRAFERSAIVKVLAHQLDNLALGTAFVDRLEKPVPFPELCSSAACARSFVVHGTQFHAGDAVMFETLWIIEAGIEQSGRMFAAARRGRLCMPAPATASSTRWTIEQVCELVDFSGKPPRMVEAWYFEPDGSVVALCTL